MHYRMKFTITSINSVVTFAIFLSLALHTFAMAIPNTNPPSSSLSASIDNSDVDTRSFSDWVKKLKKGNREKTQTQTASDKPPDISEQGSKKHSLIQAPPQVQSNNTVNGSQSGVNRNSVFGGGDSSDGAPIPKQKATTSSGTTSRKPKQINKPTRTDHDQSAMKIALAQAKGLFPRMGRRFRRD